MGIQLTSGEIIWGVSFPFDFSRKGKDNWQYVAMEGLAKIMKKYQGSVVAIGNFRTIPGNPMESVVNAVPNDFELVIPKIPTFYAGCHDTTSFGENWKEFVPE